MDKTAIVADSSAICRIGFANILARPALAYQTVEVDALAGLVEALSARPADLVVVEASLPGMNGLAGLAELRRHYRDLRIIVAVEALSRDFVLECLSAGLNGCVQKSLAADDIEDAVEMICRDRVYLPCALDSQAPLRPPACANASLTPRQRSVMDALARGKSNKQIARELGICEGTVKVHVNAAYRALGVHNRVSAATILRDLETPAPQEEEPSLSLDLAEAPGAPRWANALPA